MSSCRDELRESNKNKEHGFSSPLFVFSFLFTQQFIMTISVCRCRSRLLDWKIRGRIKIQTTHSSEDKPEVERKNVYFPTLYICIQSQVSVPLRHLRHERPQNFSIGRDNCNSRMKREAYTTPILHRYTEFYGTGRLDGHVYCASRQGNLWGSFCAEKHLGEYVRVPRSIRYADATA